MKNSIFMKRPSFLLITAILSFVFGAMMFFIPSLAAGSLGMTFTPESGSLLRGMGGLIIGTGLINLLLRNNQHANTVSALLWTNIITHLLGLSTDLLGVYEGILQTVKMAPVEITHLFVGIGSVICLAKLKKNT